MYPIKSPPPQDPISWHALELGKLRVGQARFIPRWEGEYRTEKLAPRIHGYASRACVKVSIKKRPEGVYITRIA